MLPFDTYDSLFQKTLPFKVLPGDHLILARGSATPYRFHVCITAWDDDEQNLGVIGVWDETSSHEHLTIVVPEQYLLLTDTPPRRMVDEQQLMAWCHRHAKPHRVRHVRLELSTTGPVQFGVTSKAPSPAILYTTPRIKPLAELRPSDVPRGVDPYDMATDYEPVT